MNLKDEKNYLRERRISNGFASIPEWKPPRKTKTRNTLARIWDFIEAKTFEWAGLILAEWNESSKRKATFWDFIILYSCFVAGGLLLILTIWAKR